MILKIVVDKLVNVQTFKDQFVHKKPAVYFSPEEPCDPSFEPALIFS